MARYSEVGRLAGTPVPADGSAQIGHLEQGPALWSISELARERFQVAGLVRSRLSAHDSAPHFLASKFEPDPSDRSDLGCPHKVALATGGQTPFAPFRSADLPASLVKNAAAV